jgi:ADP-heptose:LPS heptosyltransferase
MPHKKQLGEKHEVDYNLELIAASGFDVSGADRKPGISVSEEKVYDIERRLKELGLPEKIIAIHAGASCRSKMWPFARFAETADKLSEKYSAGIVIVGDASCGEDARILAGLMKNKPVDLTGSLGLSQLAALFSISCLIISNDSGPAHLAAAVGSAVIVIFGRNDPGLSPARWAPVTEKKRILHSPPPCSPCLAHNCNLGFRCLDNITVSEVVSAASELFGL